MTFDPSDEIMLEVRKLQILIRDCCPEVMHESEEESEDGALKDASDALSRHRRNILSEAVDQKKVR